MVARPPAPEPHQSPAYPPSFLLLSPVVPRDALVLRVKARPQVILADTQRRRVARENPQPLEDRRDLPLARHLCDPIGHHRPHAWPALHEPHALQLVVRLDYRVRRYREVPGEPAYRRQPLPGPETSDLDRVPYLIHDLHVDRNPTTRV